MPKVTIGMPVFNRAAVLPETIRQVLGQTFTDFELVIYNDGSTDASASVVRSFSDPRITFFDEINLGPPHPLNTILAVAKGEYIIILHDHDFFHPALIEKSVAALDAEPGAAFCLQGCGWIAEDGRSNFRKGLLDISRYNSGRRFGEEMLTAARGMNSIFHACSMVRRSAYTAVGNLYDPRFGLYADVNLWLRLLNQFNFVYLPEVLLTFREREANHYLDRKRLDVIQWLYTIYKENMVLYWPEPSEHLPRTKRLTRRYYGMVRECCLLYGSRDEEELFKNSLLELSNQDSPILDQVIAKLVLRFSGLTVGSRALLCRLNGVRKRFF